MYDVITMSSIISVVILIVLTVLFTYIYNVPTIYPSQASNNQKKTFRLNNLSCHELLTVFESMPKRNQRNLNQKICSEKHIPENVSLNFCDKIDKTGSSDKEVKICNTDVIQLIYAEIARICNTHDKCQYDGGASNIYFDSKPDYTLRSLNTNSVQKICHSPESKPEENALAQTSSFTNSTRHQVSDVSISEIKNQSKICSDKHDNDSDLLKESDAGDSDWEILMSDEQSAEKSCSVSGNISDSRQISSYNIIKETSKNGEAVSTGAVPKTRSVRTSDCIMNHKKEESASGDSDMENLMSDYQSTEKFCSVSGNISDSRQISSSAIQPVCVHPVNSSSDITNSFIQDSPSSCNMVTNIKETSKNREAVSTGAVPKTRSVRTSECIMNHKKKESASGDSDRENLMTGKLNHQSVETFGSLSGNKISDLRQISLSVIKPDCVHPDNSPNITNFSLQNNQPFCNIVTKIIKETSKNEAASTGAIPKTGLDKTKEFFNSIGSKMKRNFRKKSSEHTSSNLVLCYKNEVNSVKKPESSDIQQVLCNRTKPINTSQYSLSPVSNSSEFQNQSSTLEAPLGGTPASKFNIQVSNEFLQYCVQCFNVTSDSNSASSVPVQGILDRMVRDVNLSEIERNNQEHVLSKHEGVSPDIGVDHLPIKCISDDNTSTVPNNFEHKLIKLEQRVNRVSLRLQKPNNYPLTKEGTGLRYKLRSSIEDASENAEQNTSFRPDYEQNAASVINNQHSDSYLAEELASFPTLLSDYDPCQYCHCIADSVNFPCGHSFLCFNCAQIIFKVTKKCSECYEDIDSVQRLKG